LRMKRKVFVITASKGGSGKTPLALSLYLAAVFSGRKILGIDMNMNNPDFSDILKTTVDLKSGSQPFLLTQGVVGAFRYSVLRLRDNALIAFNERPTLIGIKDFWDTIYELLVSNNSTNGFDAVIDTGYNFYAIEPPINDKMNKLFHECEFYFFHIWSISSGMKRNSYNYATSRLENFKITMHKFSQLRGSAIDGNVVHCFTPQVFVDRSIGSLLKFWRTGEFLYHDINLRITDKVLTFDMLQKLLKKIAQEILKYPLGTYTLDHKRILEVWTTVIKDFVKEHFSMQMPQNLLLVPNVYVNLATIASDMILQVGKTFRVLEERLGKFYDDILAFLTATPLLRDYFININQVKILY